MEYRKGCTKTNPPCSQSSSSYSQQPSTADRAEHNSVALSHPSRPRSTIRLSRTTVSFAMGVDRWNRVCTLLSPTTEFDSGSEPPRSKTDCVARRVATIDPNCMATMVSWTAHFISHNWLPLWRINKKKILVQPRQTSDCWWESDKFKRPRKMQLLLTSTHRNDKKNPNYFDNICLC